MKKNFLYAGALAVLFASCSNEDGLSPQAGPGQAGGGVVNELKISLASGTGPGTRTSPGTGTENTLFKTLVFVKADADGPDLTDANNPVYDYKYLCLTLGEGVTTTVAKHVQVNAKVYVFANYNGWSETVINDFLTGVNKTPGKEDAEFQKMIEEPTKLYLTELNPQSGRFMMSGVGTVPAGGNPGAGATVLSIDLKRDLAKVSFTVKGRTTVPTTTQIREIENITIRRSSDKAQPFAMSGTTPTTYVLPYGYGDPKYKQDGLKTGGTFEPSNSAKDPADATDFAFLYGSDQIETTTGGDHKFKDFYVFPNAATTAEKGTIIVVKAKIKTSTDGGTTWVDVQDSKYYKARLSSSMDAYNTAKNSSYTIVATLKGEGVNDPTGPDGPDVENTEGDLNINVTVEPWKLVISNQEIE